MNTQISLSISQRRVIRKSAGCDSHDSIRIEIIPGIALAPNVAGKRYWKTQFTRHYASGKSFSRTLYTPSTRRVIVGELWAAQA